MKCDFHIHSNFKEKPPTLNGTKNGEVQMRTTTYQLKIEGIEVDVVKKDIKNINLRIYRSDGKVRVSSPKRIRKAIIRNFLVEKIEWIKKHLKKIEQQLPDQPMRYESGEGHHFFGEEYTLIVSEAEKKPEVTIDRSGNIIMTVRPGSDQITRERVMREWYRARLKEKIPAYIQKYEIRLGVKAKEWSVKKMKTRWGTCNIRASRIWLNLELAKKKEICLEYVVLHELAHLIERYHNKRFKAILSREMPEWRSIEKLMNGHPIQK